MNQLLVVFLLALVAGGSCGKPPVSPGKPTAPPSKPTAPTGKPAGPPGKPAGPPGKPAGPPGKPAGPPGKPAGIIQQALCTKALSASAAESEQWRNATVTCVAAQPGLDAIIAGLHPHSGESNEGFSGDHHFHDVASALEANGYLANATALRECIANATGLVDSTGAFDMAALKANIKGKVAGQSISANTQLGLDNCPAVVEFDVYEYLHCVWTYCVTGAAPTTGG